MRMFHHVNKECKCQCGTSLAIEGCDWPLEQAARSSIPVPKNGHDYKFVMMIVGNQRLEQGLVDGFQTCQTFV
jgi:hypothetical protein